MQNSRSSESIADSGLDVRAVVSELVRASSFSEVMAQWKLGAPVCWDGVWLGAIAPLAAALIESQNSPLVLIIAQPTDAETVARDLDYLLGRPCDVFPPGSDDSEIESLLQQEIVLRLQVLSRLQSYASRKLTKQSDDLVAQAPVVITTLPALMQPVPTPSELIRERKILQVGQRMDLGQLRDWLLQSGYHSTTSVQLPGEFTFRGGILDVFTPDASEPRRIEWFDDEIESVRVFDAISQRSLARLDRVDLIVASGASHSNGSLFDFLSKDTMFLLHEPPAIIHLAGAFLARVPFPERFTKPNQVLQSIQSMRWGAAFQISPVGNSTSSDNETTVPKKRIKKKEGSNEVPPHLSLENRFSHEFVQSTRIPLNDVQRIGGELEQLHTEVDRAVGKDRNALLIAVNEGEAERIRDLLRSSDALATSRLQIILGSLQSGFEILPSGTIVLTVNQMLRRAQLRRSTRRVPSRAIDSFLDLRDGDLVVHLAHGIGVYRGLQLIAKLGQKLEHLEIEFAEGTKLFVPSSKIDLVQRYVGGSKMRPKLAKIGSQSWVRQKKAAEAAVTDMAADLLELQAQRRSQIGIAFSEDTIWQSQFDASFPYEETPDQITAITALKRDMILPRPMDRLICGDVGFGKTEVAMRAAFKAIDSGYQVAVLVPTTVLAEQHYKTFRERMAEFPFDIAKLSRFSTTSEQKGTLVKLAKGQIDIVIGTHRLASKDVEFFNLGLVIVDEEQRFGVEVKERLKRQRTNIDLLTLSATPIPRTLHMSLLGVRDISNLETAPEERMAVETRVVRFNEAIIRNAVLRELNRGGQIYFVHNRINDIDLLAAKLQRIVPEARLAIGHGQMPEHKLEQVMVDFIEHRFDLLLSTTIIESGLDIPNANTIFIDEADRYGLSELHQLRGRVGRFKHQAHCYLLVDRHKHLTPDAARRLHAIEEYSQIGAGFGIAMRDLEIRGAGNLLGTQQSGHIAAVGYELYCQLLENAVRQLRHDPPKLSIEVELQFPTEAYIPTDYVPEMRHKIDLYRRLSRIDSIGSLFDFRQELLDRFGPPPIVVERLLELAELRMDATIWLVRQIGIEENYLVLTYGDRNRIDQLARKHHGKLKVLDRQRAYWPMIEGDKNFLAVAQSILRPSS